jgi:hypothetical protein
MMIGDLILLAVSSAALAVLEDVTFTAGSAHLWALHQSNSLRTLSPVTTPGGTNDINSPVAGEGADMVTDEKVRTGFVRKEG